MRHRESDWIIKRDMVCTVVSFYRLVLFYIRWFFSLSDLVHRNVYTKCGTFFMFCGYRFHEIEWNWLRHERKTIKQQQQLLEIKRKKKSNEKSELTTKNKCDLRGKERQREGRRKKTEAIAGRIGQPYAYSNWNHSKYWNEKLLLLLWVGRTYEKKEWYARYVSMMCSYSIMHPNGCHRTQSGWIHNMLNAHKRTHTPSRAQLTCSAVFGCLLFEITC